MDCCDRPGSYPWQGTPIAIKVNKSVSTIIPVKDFTPFLKKSLRSTISCLKEDMELILVDDRMDSRCGLVLSRFQGNPQVKIVKARIRYSYLTIL